MTKRLLALMLSISLTIGFFPTSSMAVYMPSLQIENGYNGASKSSVEQAAVSVEYDSVSRSSATITYHKEGIAAAPFNLIFLVDASKQGAQSYKSFEKMMINSGASYIYDHKTDSTVQLISYQNSAYNTDILQDKNSFINKLNSIIDGEGTANEPVALDEAISAVKTVHSTNDYPTIVFWVLGERFGSDTNAVEEKLKELDNELTNDKDAFITWQYADQPNELLSKYATKYTEAHSDTGQATPAAYANNNATLMQEEMASDIEQIVHDHYHDIHFSLPLSDGQNLVKRITGAHYKADGTIADITTEVNPNGKQLDVTIDWLCRQISVDFILEVELDTSVYNKQTVIPADSIIVNHEGTNGGLHSGIFDNEIVVDLQLDFPAAELDRTAHNITFQNADGVDAITNKLSGEIVTLPMGEGIIKEGSSFGGWNVVSGANLGHHYNPGEIISMPSGDMTLAPAFGNVEVELAIDYTQGEKPDYKNQMAEFTYSPFNFNGKLMSDGNTIDENSIVSIQFIDFLPQYDTMPNDPDATRVKLTNVPNAVYARHIGATDEDRVVAYLAPSQSEDGKYDLYVAGHGG